jgi:crotonobetainyl-CoA:carnitine CoA-transferase CaiB-like acyl-CoA transferase
MTDPRRLPLAGIRVLDFGHILAGPFCVRLLADLGAEVVKIETSSRQGRTGARRGRTRVTRSGRTLLLADINRNRRSIDLDLKSGAGLEIARRLADRADVLVENFSSGVMDRLGLGYDLLAATNPGLIYASMSAYGHTGPRSDWTGMNVNLQACSGLMLATGEEGDPPIGISNSWNDYIGGLHTALAIIGALDERRETGRGRNLDMSQFECSVGMIGSLLLHGAVTGRPPARLGSRSPTVAPQGCYRCAGKDEWCVITVQDGGQWQALLGVLGNGADALRRPQLDTPAGRIAHQDEIDAVIEAWTGSLAPVDVERRLTEAGVPAAAMRRGNQVADLEEWRQLLRPIENAGDSDWRVVCLPFTFAGVSPVRPTGAPRIGEHNGEVLRDWLGIDDPASVGLASQAAE